MGCGLAVWGDGKIEMKRTKLEGMDQFFNDVQSIVDEIYELKGDVEDKRDALLRGTYINKVWCGNTHHAIVGIVFAIATKANNINIEDIVKVTTDEPFVEVKKDLADGPLSENVDDLAEYIEALMNIKDKIESLMEKSKEFSEKAGELPDKAKEDIKDSTDLGVIAKVKVFSMYYVSKYLNRLFKILPLIVNNWVIFLI